MQFAADVVIQVLSYECAGGEARLKASGRGSHCAGNPYSGQEAGSRAASELPLWAKQVVPAAANNSIDS